jgi:hypothetical protein
MIQKYCSKRTSGPYRPGESSGRSSACVCLKCGLELKVYYETALSCARAWSIWSYAYVATAVIVIVSPLRASDS